MDNDFDTVFEYARRIKEQYPDMSWIDAMATAKGNMKVARPASYREWKEAMGEPRDAYKASEEEFESLRRKMKRDAE